MTERRTLALEPSMPLKAYDGQAACSRDGRAASLFVLRRDLAQARIKQGVGHETIICFVAIYDLELRNYGMESGATREPISAGRW